MELGDLEAEVLSAVKSLDEASGSEILKELRKNKDIAYTTVTTTLDRLYKKGLLNRKETLGRGGIRYLYSSKHDAEIEGKIVEGAIGRLLSAFGSHAVSMIYEKLEEVPKSEVKELKERVEGKGRRGGAI
jgi:predicted transcriptional regulator